jgi:hypothetical protein
MVNEIVGATLSGCDPGNATKQSRCKPDNLTVSKDGVNGGGWPTYWALPTDPEIEVICSGGPCPFQAGFKVRMPAGARRQIATQPVAEADRHLTIIDKDGSSGLGKPNYEYDFYQVQEETVPSSGSIHVTSAGATDLNGSGRTDPPGNTNAAGFGNLAGRIRVEELAAGAIKHALTIAVPCTLKSNAAYPAQHVAVPKYCTDMGENPNWPAMGQLFWLDLDAAQIKADAVSGKAAPWAQTILTAMHDHGMYVNDNGGYQNAFFQLQTESQAQYTSLGASDPWQKFATDNSWAGGVNQDYVGRLQGSPSDASQAAAFYAGWRAFWQQHLHALEPCQLPTQTCIN